MPSTDPANYPIATPNVGSQYTMFFAETTKDIDIVDFNTTPALQLFSNSTGLSIDITKLDAEYYSVVTPIKSNGATVIAGEQATFATPTSVAYIAAKTTNNYTTGANDTGISIFTGLEGFTLDITRGTSNEVVVLHFTVNTKVPSIFNVPIPTNSTIEEVVVLVNAAAPLINDVPAMSMRLWIGLGSTVFDIIPDTTTQLIFSEKVALVDTHMLTAGELETYPSTITIVYPSLQGNDGQFFNVLLYNNLTPELSFQFYGVRNKGFNFTFANNGLTNFTYPQMGVGALSQPNVTTVATPYYIDNYEKMYTQSTYNTAPYWDGIYAGQMTDCTINLEYDLASQLNITGLQFPYPNGKYSLGVTGGAILNDTSYEQFFIDMVNNEKPSFVLETVQLINGVSYQMLSIQNYINGKPANVTLQPGALQLAFPADAVGQVDANVELSNMFVFLHDEIPNFVTHLS